MQNPKIDSRRLFQAACSGKPLARPPFWLMRQAGRYLPEYRELKSKYGFLGIVKTPEVGVEAALQPIRRFDFDCAILFSDILVVSEALGFPYNFKEKGGIILDKKIDSARDIAVIRDNRQALSERLNYVRENLVLLRKELPNKAVLGFCGSPFTIGAYMVEGESAEGFPKYRKFIKEYPQLFAELMQELAMALSDYAQMQAQCGIDAFQIFDSHAALSQMGDYFNTSARYITPIIKSISDKTRTILFANGMTNRFEELLPTKADIYSLDSSIPLSSIFNKYKSRAEFSLQGNLPPQILSEGSITEVAQKTRDVVTDMLANSHHIFNLGHGIRPDAKLENVQSMCDTIKQFI